MAATVHRAQTEEQSGFRSTNASTSPACQPHPRFLRYRLLVREADKGQPPTGIQDRSYPLNVAAAVVAAENVEQPAVFETFGPSTKGFCGSPTSHGPCPADAAFKQ